MRCDTAHEALSARLDGESVDDVLLDIHLDVCPDCATWLQDAHAVTRRVRLSPAPDVPDLTSRIVGAVVTDTLQRARGRRPAAQAALLGVAALQLLVGLPALLGWNDHHAPQHIAHEMGAFTVALGLAYLVTGLQPFRAGGLLPFAGIASGLLAATSAADLIGHRTAPAAEAPHLLAVAGFLLVWKLLDRAPPPSSTGVSWWEATRPEAQPAPRAVAARALAGRALAVRPHSAARQAARQATVRLASRARRRRRALAIAVGAMLSLPLLAGTAAAHASLASSDPASGTVLQQSPDAISLRFNEPVTLLPNGIRIVDAAGKRVDRGDAEHGDSSSVVRVGLRPELARGSYLVDWRIVSADSHPLGGGFTFSIGAPGPVGSSAAGSGGDTAVGVLSGVGRLVTFICLALLAGGTAFALLCWPQGLTRRRMRRLVLRSGAATAVAAVVGLLLQGPYSAGASLAGVLDPELLRTTVTSPYGTAVLLRLGLLALAAVWLVRLFRGGIGWLTQATGAAGVVLGLGLLATLPLAGHANTGSNRALALLTDTGHLAGMSVWLGGLAVLAGLLVGRTVQPELPEVVARFSRVAFLSVVVLVGTGVLASLREVGSVVALLQTSYGKLLLVKLAFVLVILAVASLSRSWVHRQASAQLATPDTITLPDVETSSGTAARSEERELVLIGARSFAAGSAGGDSARLGAAGRRIGTTLMGAVPLPRPTDPAGDGTDGDRPSADLRTLRRSVLAELVIAVVILTVTAVLVVTQPAKSSARSSAAPARPVSTETTVVAGPVTVAVEASSHDPGQMTVRADTYDANGLTKPVPEVTGSLSLPDRALGPIPLRFVGEGPGHFTAVKVSTAIPGTWTLTLSVRVDDFNAYTAQVPIPIAG